MRRVIKASTKKHSVEYLNKMIGAMQTVIGDEDLLDDTTRNAVEVKLIELERELDGIEHAGPVLQSQVSFDFIHPGKYPYYRVTQLAMEAVSASGVTAIAADTDSVDYSDYPEYADESVSQCTVDFEWSGNYDADLIKQNIEEYFEELDYEIIGFDFRALEK